MRFCSSCGTKLNPKLKRVGGAVSTAYVCRNCGFSEEVPAAEDTMVVEQKGEGIRVVGTSYAKLKSMPTTPATCPSCSNNTAYYWISQTKSLEEPSTQFFRCTRCDYTWRMH